MKEKKINIIYISISEKGPSGGGKILYKHSDLINNLNNRFTSQVLHLKKRKSKKWVNSLIIPEYIIDIKNKSKKTIELIEYHEKLKNLEIQNKEGKLIENKDKKKINKKTFKKKRYFKKTK